MFQFRIFFLFLSFLLIYSDYYTDNFSLIYPEFTSISIPSQLRIEMLINPAFLQESTWLKLCFSKNFDPNFPEYLSPKKYTVYSGENKELLLKENEHFVFETNSNCFHFSKLIDYPSISFFYILNVFFRPSANFTLSASYFETIESNTPLIYIEETPQFKQFRFAIKTFQLDSPVIPGRFFNATLRIPTEIIFIEKGTYLFLLPITRLYYIESVNPEKFSTDEYLPIQKKFNIINDETYVIGVKNCNTRQKNKFIYNEDRNVFLIPDFFDNHTMPNSEVEFKIINLLAFTDNVTFTESFSFASPSPDFFNFALGPFVYNFIYNETEALTGIMESSCQRVKSLTNLTFFVNTSFIFYNSTRWSFIFPPEYNASEIYKNSDFVLGEKLFKFPGKVNKSNIYLNIKQNRIIIFNIYMIPEIINLDTSIKNTEARNYSQLNIKILNVKNYKKPIITSSIKMIFSFTKINNLNNTVNEHSMNLTVIENYFNNLNMNFSSKNLGENSNLRISFEIDIPISPSIYFEFCLPSDIINLISNNKTKIKPISKFDDILNASISDNKLVISSPFAQEIEPGILSLEILDIPAMPINNDTINITAFDSNDGLVFASLNYSNLNINNDFINKMKLFIYDIIATNLICSYFSDYKINFTIKGLFPINPRNLIFIIEFPNSFNFSQLQNLPIVKISIFEMISYILDSNKIIIKCKGNNFIIKEGIIIFEILNVKNPRSIAPLINFNIEIYNENYFSLVETENKISIFLKPLIENSFIIPYSENNELNQTSIVIIEIKNRDELQINDFLIIEFPIYYSFIIDTCYIINNNELILEKCQIINDNTIKLIIINEVSFDNKFKIKFEKVQNPIKFFFPTKFHVIFYSFDNYEMTQYYYDSEFQNFNKKIIDINQLQNTTNFLNEISEYNYTFINKILITKHYEIVINFIKILDFSCENLIIYVQDIIFNFVCIYSQNQIILKNFERNINYNDIILFSFTDILNPKTKFQLQEKFNISFVQNDPEKIIQLSNSIIDYNFICNSSCFNCENLSNNCLSCLENKNLYEGNCVEICPDKYYSNEFQCKKCSDKLCKKCNANNICEVCDDKFKFLHEDNHTFCVSENYTNLTNETNNETNNNSNSTNNTKNSSENNKNNNTENNTNNKTENNTNNNSENNTDNKTDNNTNNYTENNTNNNTTSNNTENNTNSTTENNTNNDTNSTSNNTNNTNNDTNSTNNNTINNNTNNSTNNSTNNNTTNNNTNNNSNDINYTNETNKIENTDKSNISNTSNTSTQSINNNGSSQEYEVYKANIPFINTSFDNQLFLTYYVILSIILLLIFKIKNSNNNTLIKIKPYEFFIFSWSILDVFSLILTIIKLIILNQHTFYPLFLIILCITYIYHIFYYLKIQKIIKVDDYFQKLKTNKSFKCYNIFSLIWTYRIYYLLLSYFGKFGNLPFLISTKTNLSKLLDKSLIFHILLNLSNLILSLSFIILTYPKFKIIPFYFIEFLLLQLLMILIYILILIEYKKQKTLYEISHSVISSHTTSRKIVKDSSDSPESPTSPCFNNKEVHLKEEFIKSKIRSNDRKSEKYTNPSDKFSDNNLNIEKNSNELNVDEGEINDKDKKFDALEGLELKDIPLFLRELNAFNNRNISPE